MTIDLENIINYIKKYRVLPSLEKIFFVARTTLIMSCISSLISFATTPSEAAEPKKIKDPIFWLSYSYSKIHFEAVPSSILSNCGLATDPNISRKFIYASADYAGWSYLVIGGAVHDESMWESDFIGEFLRANVAHCELIDPADEIFYAPTGTSISLPTKVFEDLAADAVRRYSNAYGSYGKFMTALKTQHVVPDTRKEAILAAALARAAPR